MGHLFAMRSDFFPAPPRRIAQGMDIAFPRMTAGRAVRRELPIRAIAAAQLHLRRPTMAWSKPEFIDWRFGFEITLYIANR